PFTEPLTRHNYVRARWYDPETGTWLTPDPLGYRDSSNLYSYCHGDPVNRRDPTGQYETDVHRVFTQYLALRAGFSPAEALLIAAGDEAVDQDPVSEPLGNARAGNWPAVRRNHFAISSGEIKVRRNSPIARRGVETATDLGALGRGLHVLQDSYSHEDAYVGDIADQYKKYGGVRLGTVMRAIKDPEEGIGHPDKPEIGSRADNHLTDQTWTDPGKAVEMARTTSDALVDYRLRSGQITTAQAAALRSKWDRLQPSVSAFAQAKTKAEKQQWLQRYAQTLEFTEEDLKDMSIPKD
ncbi:MAG: RHS repeat-associated core domain-containing protein, partial [Thermoanaerobaculia bacterium]